MDSIALMDRGALFDAYQKLEVRLSSIVEIASKRRPPGAITAQRDAQHDFQEIARIASGK